MELETLFVTRGEGELEGALTITLNRPKVKNAINAQMWLDLLQVLRATGRDTSVRVVVLTGAGGAFCSGADLSGRASSADAPSQRPPHQLVAMREVADVAMELHRLPMPVIAKVGGVAAGAGCNMALGCDLIVASDTARFSEIFAKRGLAIDFGGSWILPRLTGLHKAKELVFFGDVISAQEAERIGIVNRVVRADELDAFVDEWTKRLLAGPPLALRMSKRLLNDGARMSMDQALEAEGWTQSVTIAGTADTTEAFTAFIQKRPPNFTGH
jgi:enoyl-CoA hydratase/carnithine racemase